VRDDAVRAEAIAAAESAIGAAGFELLARADSVLPGPKGNREAFVRARRR
jgi:hypothetical protein